MNADSVFGNSSCVPRMSSEQKKGIMEEHEEYCFYIRLRKSWFCNDKDLCLVFSMRQKLAAYVISLYTLQDQICMIKVLKKLRKLILKQMKDFILSVKCSIFKAHIIFI